MYLGDHGTYAFTRRKAGATINRIIGLLADDEDNASNSTNGALVTAE